MNLESLSVLAVQSQGPCVWGMVSEWEKSVADKVPSFGKGRSIRPYGWGVMNVISFSIFVEAVRGMK